MRRENELYKPAEGEEGNVFQFTPNTKYYKSVVTGTIWDNLKDDIADITIDTMPEFTTGLMELGFEIPDLSAIVINY